MILRRSMLLRCLLAAGFQLLVAGHSYADNLANFPSGGAQSETLKRIVSRVEELEQLEGRDFPRSHQSDDVVTVYEAPGLRLFYLFSEVNENDKNSNCVPVEIHADIASPFLLNNFEEALRADNGSLALQVVDSALTYCWSSFPEDWPDLPGRVIRMHYLGTEVGAIEYNARVEPILDEFLGVDIERLIAEVGVQKSEEVKTDPVFLEEQLILDDFWESWIGGTPFSSELTEATSRNALINSDLAVAEVYQRKEARIGGRLLNVYEIGLEDVLDAAILGHPEAAYIVAIEIERLLDLEDVISKQSTALSDEQAKLLAIMNHFFAKSMAVKYAPSLKYGKRVASLNLGLSDELISSLVSEKNPRTRSDQLKPADTSGLPPSAVGLLQALREYHEADCSRYTPYTDQLSSVQRSLTDGETDFLTWNSVPTPVKSAAGFGCVIQLDLVSMPLQISDVSNGSCSEQGSTDLYLCEVEIGFDCPLRGFFTELPGSSDFVQSICDGLQTEWRFALGVEVQRQGQKWISTRVDQR